MSEIKTATLKDYIAVGMVEEIIFIEFEKGIWMVNFEITGQQNVFRYISTHGKTARTFTDLNRAYTSIHNLIDSVDCTWKLLPYSDDANKKKSRK